MSDAVTDAPPRPLNGMLLINTGRVPVVPEGICCETLIATRPFQGWLFNVKLLTE